ncbi:gluconate 2-dehydrogenase subunit 3 family protein [Nakamurella lactea]|uniref:gluconate 2-dehydrogenase subunit 3 family protein n=1 Tax=Nakamurella lactea TaxID=459515 RepID=UPI00042A1B43|nr:gluconate 2-dehydrogenase subunit 3 family protein [Nakamurella lactea]
MIYRSPAQRAITPQHRGRFPGFDVVERADDWDALTAGTVLARLGPAAATVFFTETEAGIAGALLDRLLAQDGEPRIPVLALIDARLAAGETDGWHYDDLPEDGQAWRDTLRYLESDASSRYGTGFAETQVRRQTVLIQQVQDLAAASECWHGLPAERVWSLWTRYACTAFYSHPWAWNEIGFSGPAYPRGYLNPGVDALERFEVADHDDVDPGPFADRVERARHRHLEDQP